jgi:large subunit ribosomal protein L3
MKGIIGRKIGMTQIFDNNGTALPVTVIEAGPCYVTQIRTQERDGYTAVQLGFDELSPKRNGDSRLNQPRRGHLRRKDLLENGVDLPDLRVLREFRLKNGEELDLQEGAKLTVDVFAEGDIVDIVGISKGRGFAGTVKRHNFNRQPKTHGQSDRERAPGSVGQSARPAHTFKGTRMAGHMGTDRVTIQNLRVVVVDAERNLLAVRGSVPGAKGGIVVIKESSKQRRQRQRG